MRPQPTIKAAVSLGETTCSHAAAAMSPNAKPARPATSAAANIARRKIESSKAETPSMARPNRSEQRLDGVPSDGEAADPQVTIARGFAPTKPTPQRISVCPGMFYGRLCSLLQGSLPAMPQNEKVQLYSRLFAGLPPMKLARVFSAVDRSIAGLLRLAGWLVLPIVVLLFLQWPVRDIFRVYSREANDLGQWIFAIYVAVSVTAATRAGTHLGSDAVARFYPGRIRQALTRLGAILLAPWALFVILGSKDIVLGSIRGLEAFSDTNNPGYFLIKTALWILAGLMLTQAAIDIAQPRRND